MKLRAAPICFVLSAATGLFACANLLDIPGDLYVVTGDGGGSGDADVGTPDTSPPINVTCTGTIHVKSLVDMTGPTSDVGVPFQKGELDSLREINATGGIHGCQIDFVFQDYAYVPAKASEIYNGWKASADWDQVSTIFGWGTADSILLAPTVKADRKPFLSASYFGGIATPLASQRDINVPELSPTFEETIFPQHFTSEGFPFNFFAGTDYSTGARIGMFHAKLLGGKRVAFMYCSSAYCLGPIPAGREYARRQGLSLGRDLKLELTDDQATYDQKVLQFFQEEKDYKMANPTYQIVDWIWGGNTTKTSAYLAKAVAKANTQLALNPPVQLIINNWGFDENLYGVCGNDCVDRVHGIMPFVAYGDTRAGEMAKVIALHDKWRKIDYEAALDAGAGDAADGGAPRLEAYQNVRYIQGYVNVLMFKLAAERVVSQGKPVNGENIKSALEGFTSVDTGGLTARLTFTTEDHRPQSTESIYKISAAGKLVLESDRTITLESSWLGW